jgi:hypothetical protein
VIEAIFGDLIKDLVAEPLYHRFQRGFLAMIDQEIETTETGKPTSRLFDSTLFELQSAARELRGSAAENQHVELARLALVEAAHLDPSLTAARAALYAGFCHRLRSEPQELEWYERSFERILAVEARLAQRAVNQSLPLAGVMARSDSPMLDLPALFAVACRRGLQNNLQVQRQTVREHKEAVAAVVKTIQRRVRWQEAQAASHPLAREQKARAAQSVSN